MEMVNVKTALIKVQEGRRVNQKNVVRIMESIKKMGLMSPIFVTNEFVLVAGAHRLEAFKQLQNETIDGVGDGVKVAAFKSFEEIPCIITDETNEAKLKIMEITENMDRNSKFTPVEMCKMAHEARESWKAMGIFNDGHRQKAEEGKLRNEDLANLTKVSKSTIKNYTRIWENLSASTREYVLDERESFSMSDLMELAKLKPEEQEEQATSFKATKEANKKAQNLKDEQERVNKVNEDLKRDGEIDILKEKIRILTEENKALKKNQSSNKGIDKRMLGKLIHPDVFNGALTDHPKLIKNLNDALAYINAL
jgi:hypothetical protein